MSRPSETMHPRPRTGKTAKDRKNGKRLGVNRKGSTFDPSPRGHLHGANKRGFVKRWSKQQRASHKQG